MIETLDPYDVTFTIDLTGEAPRVVDLPDLARRLQEQIPFTAAAATHVRGRADREGTVEVGWRTLAVHAFDAYAHANDQLAAAGRIACPGTPGWDVAGPGARVTTPEIVNEFGWPSWLRVVAVEASVVNAGA